MSKFLVTGGCGFIGSHLTAELVDQGHEVIILDDLSNGKIIHPKATFIKQDIRQYDAISDVFLGLDGCFHLAAVPTVEVELDTWHALHATNLTGSLNVFKAAIAAGNVPVVYMSSSSVYGDAMQLPLQEDRCIHPLSAYGCDKLSTELNAYFVNHEYQLPNMGLRLFNVYGPHQQVTSPYTGVITRFITALLENKPMTIFGDGEQTRDFVFVGDVITNIMHAMNSLIELSSCVVNICTGKHVTINQLSRVLAKLMHRECTIDYQSSRKLDTRNSVGCQKRMQELGFKISHSLEEGLAKTVDYFTR